MRDFGDNGGIVKAFGATLALALALLIHALR